jgi:hypothetical protein
VTTLTADAAQVLIGPGTGGGRVARGRRRRSVMVWAVLCLGGLLPSLLDAGAGWQAFGLGLWFPGAGFLAADGWLMVLALPCLLAMGLAWVAWFGSGMVIAPVIVWAGSAVAAGALVGHTTDAAPWIVAGVTLAGALGAFAAARLQVGRTTRRRTERNAVLPEELEVVAGIRTAAAAAPRAQEMTPDQLKGLRYALTLAMQPKDDWTGFNRIDIFQTSAVRYQINQLGWAIALAQSKYAPSYLGSLSEAQRRLIDRYLQKEVCSYWKYERAWGHLRLDADPIIRDNIMLTGYIGLNLALYSGNTGDFRYDAPGSLEFAVSKRRVYPHSSLDIRDSLLNNYARHEGDYCLFPCEPNWIYSACNMRGATTLAGYDRAYGTDYWPRLRETFRKRLETEFMLADGTVVALRSEHTGFAVPFPMPDSVLAKELNPILPELAHRYWALVRHELLPVVEGGRQITMPATNVDFGNYTISDAFALACFHGSAREMGDAEVAELALARIEELLDRDPTGTYYPKGSCLVNATIATDRLLDVDAWRTAVNTPTDPRVLSGPVLVEAGFPDVLVAAARTDGSDLRAVLCADTPGSYELRFERLRPGARYRVNGGSEIAADHDGRGAVTLAIGARTNVELVPTVG